jgi:Protein of unknown function (DUF4232)
VAGRRAGAGLALAALALSAAGCGIGGSTKTVTVVHVHTRTVTTTVTTTVSATTTSAATTACTGAQLSGTFKEAPGGGGAGQIEYNLTLKNTSQTSCTMDGLPAAVLLNSSGAPLPTHITGTNGGPLVNLVPGASAKATARFSPDVPGKGDSQSGACQPKAYTLKVTPNGGGTVAAPIKPPTSVCERGSLNFSTYVGG